MAFPENHLQLAALGDLLEAAVVIILMIMGAASHLLSSKPKPKPPARRPVPPANPAAGGPAGGQPTLEETLRREVEEFMRRAQGREPAPPATKTPQRQTPLSRTPQRPPARPAKPTAAERPQPVRRLTDAPGANDRKSAGVAAPRRALGAGVGQHVTQHLSGAREMAAHVQTLGADVAQADERMVAHLQEKFAHQLGALQHQDTVVQRSAARSEAAQALVDLLRQPGGARQAVLLSEIFRRPDDRWNR